jgi:hypothetical protein
VIWRRHAVSIVLIAAAFVLGIYVLVVDRGRPTAGEADARKRNLFTAFRRGEITAIEIVNGSGPIRITRAAGDGGDPAYYLGEPPSELADQAAVDRLISALEIATIERRLSGDLDRRTLGVDAAKIRLVISMGRITHRLAVGNPAPVPAGAAYAELEGDGLFVIPRDLVDDLSRPRDSYRTRALVMYSATALARIDLEGDGGARHFSRGGWGGWQMALGEGAVRVDRDAFDKVLASLADLRAETFLADAQAEEALRQDPSRIRIVVVPNGPLPRAVLDVGGSCPIDRGGTVVIRREPGPPVPACIAKEAAAALGTPADRLVDRHVFSLRPDEIEEISLVSGAAGTEIARKGTSWHLRRPIEGTLDIEEGNGLARSLGDLVSDHVEPGGVAASFAVRGTVTLHKAGEDRKEEARIGAVRGDGLVEVLRVQDGAVLAISSDAAKALFPGPLTLKSRKITDELRNNIRAISIRRDRVRQVLRRSPTGMWTIDEPRGFAPDPALADELAETLTQLRADRWIGEVDDGSYGLATPTRSIDLEIADADAGVRTISVLTGRSIARGAAARRTDDPSVFVLSEATLRAIDTLAIDRTVFMFDPAEVTKIDLGRGKPLSAGDLETAKEALSTMRAEGAVHLGPPGREEGFDHPQLALAIEAEGTRSHIRIVFGAGDVWRDMNVLYARRDGFDATFAIAQSKVRPLLDLR